MAFQDGGITRGSETTQSPECPSDADSSHSASSVLVPFDTSTGIEDDSNILERVVPGSQVRFDITRLPQATFDKHTYLAVQDSLEVVGLATGKALDGKYHAYVSLIPSAAPNTPPCLIPAEWLESLDGRPVRHDPDFYKAAIPNSTLKTWKTWLLGVRSLAELEEFEKRRKPEDLRAVTASLDSDELTLIQQRLADWGVSRDWLPSKAVSEEHIVPDVVAWLEACLALGDKAPQAVAEVVDNIKTQDWFEAARSRIWKSLSGAVQLALVAASYTAYQVLTGLA